MLQRLARWWQARREAGALHGIISGLVIAAIGIILLAPWDRAPRPKALSKRAQQHLTQRAGELAPGVIDFTRRLSLRTQELDETTDTEAIERYSAWVVEWSERFTAELEAEVTGVSAQEGVSADEVRRFLAGKLRELTGKCVAELSATPGGFRGVVLASPRLKFAPETVEQAMEAAIQKLLALLPKLPPAGQQGVSKAILAIRKSLIAFDTTPISIAFTAPAPNAIVNFIPAIAFEMTDSGSGPNPATRKLVAVNTGPIVQQTTDLANFTQVTLDDPVAGKVGVGAIGIPPSTLQDGFISLQASGTDFANNAPTTATRNLVLDRMAPAINVTSPENGSVFTSSTVPLSADVTDLVSGIAPTAIAVTLNDIDITSLITKSPGPNNILGVPNTISVSGTLAAASGNNVLHIVATDLAGNIATTDISFVVTGTDLTTEVALEIVSGNNQKGFIGLCSAEPLIVKATVMGSQTPVQGMRLVFEVTQGDGIVIGPTTLSQASTDSDGNAQASYKFGSLTGTHKILVRGDTPERRGLLPRSPITTGLFNVVVNADFTLTAAKPHLFRPEEATFLPVDPMLLDSGFFASGTVFLGAGFPGSGFDMVRMIVASADGTRAKGARVEIVFVDSNGIPLEEGTSLGQFVPPEGITDEQGRVEFIFVASSGLTTAQLLQARIQILDVASTAGTFISRPALAAISDPSERLTKISDGQMMVVTPGIVSPKPLEVEITDPGLLATAQALGVTYFFSIEPGEGFLVPVDGAGLIVPGQSVTDSQGNLVFAAIKTFTSKAAVRVVASSAGTKVVSVVSQIG